MMGSRGATRKREFSIGTRDARKVNTKQRERRQQRDGDHDLARRYNGGDHDAVEGE